MEGYHYHFPFEISTIVEYSWTLFELFIDTNEKPLFHETTSRDKTQFLILNPSSK